MSPGRSLHLRWVAVALWLGGLVGMIVGMDGTVLAGPMLAFPGWGTVGMLLAARRTDNPIGWLLLEIASVPLLTLIVPLPPEIQNGVVVIGVALALVVFPTGRPLSTVWWIPMVLVVGSWMALGVLPNLVVGDAEWPIGVGVAALSLVWCVAAPIVRFRRSRGVERAQLRWLGFASAVSGAAMITLVAGTALGSAAVAGLGGGVLVIGFGLGIPGSILVAVLRYKLFEIDRLVSRTVTYAVVALVVVVAYVVPVLVAAELVGSQSDLVTAGATLLAASAFNPARRRVAVMVDGRFNRTAFDAPREIQSLADRIRDSVSEGDVGAALVESVRRMLEPRSAALWVRDRGAPVVR